MIDGNRDHVIGILLAKDLLRYYTEADFDVRASLRPAVFIPESKPLNVLLRDFRANRNHIAIVVDEYGGVAGLITIEDVLEQIVGDIEDEYDFDESDDAIIAEEDGKYRVKALTEIAQFNDTFGTKYPDEEFNTIGGLVTDRFGRVPRARRRGGTRGHALRGAARRRPPGAPVPRHPRPEDGRPRIPRGERAAALGLTARSRQAGIIAAPRPGSPLHLQ